MAWQYWRFTSLRANGYGLNLRNWHAWLECLCRLGQLDDATRYFCLEMNSGPQRVSPDEQGARILLKFANQRGVGDDGGAHARSAHFARFGKSFRRISRKNL